MNHTTIWSTLRQTFAAWNEHEAPRLGAALAFYTVLSLAPLVIVVVGIVRLVFGHSAAQTQLLTQIESMMGHQGAEAVKAMIEHGEKPASGVIATIIGVITLLFGASGVFGELRDALNKMWEVKPESGGGLWGTIQAALLLFRHGPGRGISSPRLVTNERRFGGTRQVFWGIVANAQGLVLTAIDFGVSLGAITVLFALIFRYVPATRVAWRNVWGGGGATAVLFTIGKSLIGLYLGKAAVGSAYGAAGSLVVVIVAIYSAMIFLFGAESPMSWISEANPNNRRRAESITGRRNPAGDSRKRDSRQPRPRTLGGSCVPQARPPFPKPRFLGIRMSMELATAVSVIVCRPFGAVFREPIAGAAEPGPKFSRAPQPRRPKHLYNQLFWEYLRIRGPVRQASAKRTLRKAPPL